MKLFLPILLTSVWAFGAARLGDEEKRDLLKSGFERLKILVFQDEITRLVFEGGRTENAPFYLKDDLDRKAGTWSDTLFFGTELGKCTGIATVVFDNEVDQIAMAYSCERAPEVITGGTGKYLGAKGEAIFNQQRTRRTILLKIVKSTM